MKELSKEEMENLLITVGDGVLALSSGDVPYCIPFGFVYTGGKLYLSMFPKGRKWEILKKNNKVCFTAFNWNEDHTEWSSVVVDGRIEQVKELKEIEKVVKANIEKMGLDPVNYLEKRMAIYQKSMDNPSALKIFKVEIERMGGKKMAMMIGKNGA
jgi:nitroimidazol reductase NimA-like FMN-containing flavoprotein (pyridoxamine 5'-phosphate oxidase superfamily)